MTPIAIPFIVILTVLAFWLLWVSLSSPRQLDDIALGISAAIILAFVGWAISIA